MQVYIHILPYLPYLRFSDQSTWTFACTSRPPQRPLDYFPSLQTTIPPLHLPRVVRPQERVPLHLCMTPLQTLTYLVHQTYCITQVIKLQFFSQVTVFPQRFSIFMLQPLPPNPRSLWEDILYRYNNSTTAWFQPSHHTMVIIWLWYHSGQTPLWFQCHSG